MKKPLAFFCLLLALGICPRPAEAIFMTGKDLNRSCMSDTQKDLYDCMGYIAGVIDYHMMLQSLGTAPTIDFCLPENISIEQATVVVLKYLRSAPQNGDFIAAPVVTLALHDSFPCAAPAARTRKKHK